jgi:site-specific DNA-methyltransferase (adenine-specific)
LNLLNTVLNANCFEVLKRIEDKTVQLCIFDLPYNMCTTEKDWDKNVIDLDALWKELKRITTPTANIVFFGSQPFTSRVVMSNPKWFRYEIIWQKNICSNPGNAKKHVMKQHENILVFYKKLGTYNPQGVIQLDEPILKSNSKKSRRIQHLNGVADTYYQTQTNYPKSIQFFKVERGLHGTQKPVALLEWLINTYSNQDDIVVDITAGSFSLAVACDNNKRNWICCEKEKEFAETGLERVNENRKRLGLPEVEMCIY